MDQARLNSLQESVESQNNRIKVLEYKTIDLEARSKRKNLIFRGFTESRNDSYSDIVREFLRNTLDIFEESVIDRAPRLGRFRSGANRSIIVAFRDYASTEVIMSATHKLAGTSFSVNRDFPPEITTARKELWP